MGKAGRSIAEQHSWANVAANYVYCSRNLATESPLISQLGTRSKNSNESSYLTAIAEEDGWASIAPNYVDLFKELEEL